PLYPGGGRAAVRGVTFAALMPFSGLSEPRCDADPAVPPVVGPSLLRDRRALLHQPNATLQRSGGPPLRDWPGLGAILGQRRRLPPEQRGQPWRPAVRGLLRPGRPPGAGPSSVGK